VSCSTTFYKQLFCMKVFCAAFMHLQFGFVIFWQKDFGAKSCSSNVGEIDTRVLHYTWLEMLARDTRHGPGLQYLIERT
jgi:hypothetical protein